MQLKKLLTLSLAGALLVGTIATGSAAELDYAWYAKQNPDVVAEVGDSPEALKLHYDMYGRKEARMANTKDVEAQLRRLFKVDEYAKLYPDVKEFYGEDSEAMFLHYLSYGLLEARRPSEKVSQAVATSLKKAVEKAMTDAGIEATPGSVEVVAAITGETETLAAAKPELAVDTAELEKVTAALEQVTTVVEKAVTEAVAEVTNPAPAPAPSRPSSTTTKQPVVKYVSDNDAFKKALESDADMIQLVDGYIITVTNNELFPTRVLDLNGKSVYASETRVSGNNSVSANSALVVSGNGVELTVKNGMLASFGLRLNQSGTGLQHTKKAVVVVGSGGKLTLDDYAGVYSPGNQTGDNNDSFEGVRLTKGGTLVVEKKAWIEATASACVVVWDEDSQANNVTVKGTLKGVNGLSTNGSNVAVNHVIVLDGAHVEASKIGLYLAGKATTEIKGNSLVQGKTGVEIRNGILKVIYGTIEGTGKALSFKPNGNGLSAGSGVALSVWQHTSTSGNDAVQVTIEKGGILRTSTDVALYATNDVTANDATLSVTANLASLGNKWAWVSAVKNDANKKIVLTLKQDGKADTTFTVTSNDISGNAISGNELVDKAKIPAPQSEDTPVTTSEENGPAIEETPASPVETPNPKDEDKKDPVVTDDQKTASNTVTAPADGTTTETPTTSPNEDQKPDNPDGENTSGTGDGSNPQS